MKQASPPPAKFQRFERVTVTGGESYLGLRGTVVWRDPYYARKDPSQLGRWLYVVHLPDAECYRTFFEADLRSEGKFDPESAHLGERPEVSFDLVWEDDNPFMEGCYRLPGRSWEVMIFTKGDVPKLRCVRGSWDSGITGVVFHVPVEARLDLEYVVRALAREFGYEGWVQVQGPDSMALR